MAVFLVYLPPGSNTKRDGTNIMVVEAVSADDAKAMCKARNTGFAGDAAWDAATTVESTGGDTPLINGSVDGWVFGIRVNTDPPIDIEVVGGPFPDDFNVTGPQIAAALNAAPQITTAAYYNGVLTVAVGATDGLGDRKVEARVFPPRRFDSNGRRVNQDVNIEGWIASITDEGVTTDDLVVTYGPGGLGAYIVPKVLQTAQT